mgnify:CR=1 FL=1
MPLSMPVNADGYITVQADTAHIPYGKRLSDYSGCGWIAAFNFMKAMGQSPNAEALSQQLGRGWFSGRLGTGPLRLRRSLQAQGFRFKTACTFRGASALAKNARAGILLYVHSQGLHYVAFLRQDADRQTYLNVGPGCETFTATLDIFRRTYAKTPFCYILVPA